VFAYSWTPEFCYGHTTSWPGCEKPESYWKSYFTIHGLWPQYSTGGYPSTCTTEAFDPNAPIAVGMDTMTQYWPDVQYAETDPDYDSFWEHEWTKHGTCTGLNQTAYFQATIDLAKSFGTPSMVTSSVGGTLDAASLRTAFGGSTKVSLQCDSGKYLSGAFTCWSNVGGYPKAQVTCPSDVQSEDTCSSATITVNSL
jgi:ribonuclease T2